MLLGEIDPYSIQRPPRPRNGSPTIYQRAGLIMTLRSPLDRAVWKYRYMYQAGWVGNDFEKAIKIILDHDNASRCMPATSPFGRNLPRVNYDSDFDLLQKDADAFAREVLNFLSLPDQEDLTVEKVRGAGTSRNGLSACCQRDYHGGPSILGLSSK